MFTFALKTLLHDRGKLLVALVGVIFSLALVNLQGGLFLGMIQKASLLVDHADADLWIGHRGVHSVDIPAEIPEAWLDRLRGQPGVLRADPYIVASAPVTLPDGGYEGVWVIGSEPVSMLGSAWSFSEGTLADLHRPHAITVDVQDDWKLGSPQVGQVFEINGARARIAAKTQGILGFVTAPYFFTTLENARTFAGMREGNCSFYLVQADDGADVQQLKQRLQGLVPELEVYTAEEFSFKSRFYWATRTGIGLSFGGSTGLGILVGLILVAQSLYALVLDHLEDYATLKAMGAENRHVYRVLVLQGLIIAVAGTILGVVLVILLSTFLSSPYAPIDIPSWLLLASIGMAVAICFLSSLLPLRRLGGVDPVLVMQM